MSGRGGGRSECLRRWCRTPSAAPRRWPTARRQRASARGLPAGALIRLSDELVRDDLRARALAGADLRRRVRAAIAAPFAATRSFAPVCASSALVLMIERMGVLAQRRIVSISASAWLRGTRIDDRPRRAAQSAPRCSHPRRRRHTRCPARATSRAAWLAHPPAGPTGRSAPTPRRGARSVAIATTRRSEHVRRRTTVIVRVARAARSASSSAVSRIPDTSCRRRRGSVRAAGRAAPRTREIWVLAWQVVRHVCRIAAWNLIVGLTEEPLPGTRWPGCHGRAGDSWS